MRLTGWEGVLQGDVPLGAGLSSSAARRNGHRPGLRRCGQSRLEPRHDGQARAAGRKQMGRRQLRHHGPIDLRRRPGGPRPVDRLPLAGDRSRCRFRPAWPSSCSTRRRAAGWSIRPTTSAAAQCEAAAKFFGVTALRDVTMEQFRRSAGELDAVTRRRALHVIGENDRTVQAADAMRRGDAVELGRLMNESHRSLRDDFEVSSDALNAMVEMRLGPQGLSTAPG